MLDAKVSRGANQTHIGSRARLGAAGIASDASLFAHFELELSDRETQPTTRCGSSMSVRLDERATFDTARERPMTQ